MPRLIRFHYALLNEADEVVDSSQNGEPLELLEGASRLLPGLEKAILAQRPQAGDEFFVVLSPEDAYGHPQASLIRTLGQDMFEMPIDEIQAGAMLQLGRGGDARVVKVVGVDGDTVTVDANHPLAGLTLRFGIHIREAFEVPSPGP